MAETYTLNYGWPKPDTDKNIDEEFYKLRDVTLDSIDAALKTVQTLAEGKANADHPHTMSQIQGLIDALNGKMAANRTFVLDDLGDVNGAANAPTNYVLVKSSGGAWVASSALAALGQHGHTMAEITGLIGALNSKADAAAVNSMLIALDQAVAGRLRYLPTGAALPTSNVGPLWHDDYSSVMTWQVFNANGANFAGYASIDVGKPDRDGQSTPRPGWLKRNGASLSTATYAALWNWARHNGLVVPLASWTSGPFRFADNGNGTFRLPDNRGEFDRAWDDGRGVDAGRAFGSDQSDAFQGHKHETDRSIVARQGFDAVFDADSRVARSDDGNLFFLSNIMQAMPVTNGIHGTPRVASETRPRNLATLATIKF